MYYYHAWSWILFFVVVKSPTSIVWPEQTHSQINNVVATTGCKARHHGRQSPNHDFGILGRPRVYVKKVKLPDRPFSCIVILE